MDHEVPIVVKLEPDDLKQVRGGVGSDGQDLRWIGVWFEVDHLDCVGDCVKDVGIADACLRAVSWISTPDYRNTKSW